MDVFTKTILKYQARYAGRGEEKKSRNLDSKLKRIVKRRRKKRCFRKTEV